jgi:excisionase family DNA binding protein
MTPPTSKWRTTQYASQYLGISDKLVRRYAASGRIRAVRVNERGDYRFCDRWLDAFLESPALPVTEVATGTGANRLGGGVVCGDGLTDRTVERDQCNTNPR